MRINQGDSDSEQVLQGLVAAPVVPSVSSWLDVKTTWSLLSISIEAELAECAESKTIPLSRAVDEATDAFLCETQAGLENDSTPSSCN